MTYCTVAEVRSAIDFPDTGAPIADEDILEFIIDSEEEIEEIYKTKFGNIESSGTADGDFSTTTFSDSSKTWTVDEYIGYVVWIYGGTGEGQYREITTNTASKLTVSPEFETTPDATSNYRITKLGYKSQTLTGTGTDIMFVPYQLLVNLNALSSDDTTVTPSTVYTWPSGKMQVGGPDCEITVFLDSRPLLIDLEYIYGVYPLPRIIKRLCIILAAMRTMVAQIAGTYDDFANVSLPGGISASKGEPYMNIQSSLNYMQGEARGILYGFIGDQVSADFRGVPTYRPFSLWG